MKLNHQKMNSTPPTLVLVTGLPCSGKTTLAKRLAGDLGLILVTKDEIKERLFDALGWSDREWSRKLGAATYILLYYFIETLLGGGVSLVAESNYPPVLATEQLMAIQAKHPYQACVVECVARAEVLERRWRRRAEKALRHPGHRDAEVLEEFLNLVRDHTGEDGYARLGTPQIGALEATVDTSYRQTLGYTEALQAARSVLSKSPKAT